MKLRVTGTGVALMIITLGLALAALSGSSYFMRVATNTVMYAALAVSWNLVGGLCGYASFGNVVFFGIGAYMTAFLLIHWQLPFLLAIVPSGLVAGIFGYLVALPVMRLKGHYFSIATLGVSMAVFKVFMTVNWTGSSSGLTLPITHRPPVFFLFVMLAVLAVALGIAAWIMNGSWGYAFRAIRDDELAAASLGENVVFYKTMAFALSGVIGGLAGSVFANWISFIDPPTVFDPAITVTMLVMAMIGGGGTLWGPVIGAVIVSLLTEVLWSTFFQIHTLVLGIAIIVVVLFLPRGLMPYLQGERRLTWRALAENIRAFEV